MFHIRMSQKAHLTSQQKKVLFLTSLGGILEYYDFIIYIYLANVIEKLFFPSGTPFVATLETLIVFSIGYLFRPLGGILFSHFGDRYGRKVVFLLTVLFMAIPAFGIALLPTVSQIGITASVLLVLFRIMQGLALGGEIPGAITFVAEHVDNNRRGLATATLFFGINAGLLLGSFATMILTTMTTPATLYSYGWRVPFFVGGIFGILAVFLRRYLEETAAFSKLARSQLQRVPLITLLKHFRKNVVESALLVGLASVTIFLFLYWPHYLNQYLGFPLAATLKINTLGILIFSFTLFLTGWLADRFGYRTIYFIGMVLIILSAYPLFLLFTLHSLSLVIVSYVLFSIIFAFITGAYPAILTTLFPTTVRYTGIATGYNLGYAIWGGLSPLICTFLIFKLHSVLAPAFYLIFMAVALLIHFPFRFRHPRPLVVPAQTHRRQLKGAR
ncbi:MFS transporter [Coxiella burnetii]|uniref:MFS transporter n=1 Tax=Coxiella burnetii TaxID=777 RepID=UPI0009B81F99|nr:MFS transporter [Coxiella burnetii]